MKNKIRQTDIIILTTYSNTICNRPTSSSVCGKPSAKKRKRKKPTKDETIITSLASFVWMNNANKTRYYMYKRWTMNDDDDDDVATEYSVRMTAYDRNAESCLRARVRALWRPLTCLLSFIKQNCETHDDERTKVVCGVVGTIRNIDYNIKCTAKGDRRPYWR